MTKISQKNSRTGWTSLLRAITLCVLFPAVSTLRAQSGVDPDQAARIKELEMSRKAAEDRCLELNAALIRTEKELERVKKDLADTLLANRQLRDDLASVRLKAANILVNEEDVGEAQLLAQMQQELKRLEQSQQQLYRHLLDYKQTLESVLDVLDPEQQSAMRKLLASKLDLVVYQLDETRNLTRLTSEPETSSAETRCRVLSVNEDLGIIILDIGKAQGARVGSTWKVSANETDTTHLRIIETRHSLSAAVVVEGQQQHLIPGSTAHLVVEKRESIRSE